MVALGLVTTEYLEGKNAYLTSKNSSGLIIFQYNKKDYFVKGDWKP